MSKNIVIIQAHPDSDSFNHALADAYQRGLGSNEDVVRLNLGDLEFDPVLRGRYRDNRANPDRSLPLEERLPDTLEPDLVHAMQAIEDAKHVAFFFPVWWANLPALFKGFIDRTFLPGWAFHFEGDAAIQEKRLTGRSARVVATMDSPGFWYWLKNRRAAHHSLVGGTLDFTGIGPVKETTLYSVRNMDDAKRAEWVSKLEGIGREDGQRFLARLAS